MLVRSPWKMIDYETQVTVIQGDATLSSDISKIASQVDVLVDATSVPLQHHKPTLFYSQVAQAIITASQQTPIKHSIVMSSTGTHHGRKLPRPVNLAYEKMLGDVADDKEKAEELFQTSSLPRTIVKSPMLRNGDATNYDLRKFEDYRPSVFDFIARKTIAKVIVDIAEKYEHF